ncbi:MAG: alpha-ketoacid dehydrogenase subunit beta [Candidatus Burarchaeum sp.]|nr:alpha-ketoacid dehydrogenase subunit beta [Candidatus Burarchaeum sp.]MDO8340075.1 alpha-ketoacid dehydrogenase subunit beta [Candidatus Burarchaeum sp.]
MAKMTMIDAINSALRQEMERDPTVVVMGEDVGKNGGVFRATVGLQDKFGEVRVMDTPLAESGLVGAAIGMALSGLRPVVEIQFSGFIYYAMDQIVSHAGRMRTRSRGRYSVPMVVRSPYGGGIRALEHHSESNEAMFAHSAGLKVVIPSGPYDAKGLLISSIRDPDPVLFFEPMRLYRSVKEEVPEAAYEIPLGEANIVREGADVTLIAWGSMLRQALEAADGVKEKGVNAEVIDLRTISPFDFDTISKSIEKTGRAVIVHEAPRTCGMGAELAARAMDHNFLNLKAPVVRVTGFDVPVPLAREEDFYLPDAYRITRAINQVMSF